MNVVYTASATATGGGRNGTAGTDDGQLSFTLAVPKEMGGNGNGANPEQLFATGYAACFLGALKFVAGKEKATLPDNTTVSAKVGIGPRDDGQGFGLTVGLTIAAPGADRAQIEALVAKAHIVCPYSHATQNNIPVTLTVA